MLGSFIVIGYNLLKILPNEVPILLALGLVSIWLRRGGWSAVGLKRPESWRRIMWIAVAAAALRIALGEFVIDPLTSLVWPPAVLPSGAEEITGNFSVALMYLVIVWTFAAFGEEFGYRGYLLRRAADVGRGSPAAYWIAVVLVAVLFGLGHFYKGPSGMIDSGFAGLVLGAAYLMAGRNLWACILAHGFIDTFGVTVLYLGWDS